MVFDRGYPIQFSTWEANAHNNTRQGISQDTHYIASCNLFAQDFKKLLGWGRQTDDPWGHFFYCCLFPTARYSAQPFWICSANFLSALACASNFSISRDLDLIASEI